MTSLTAIVAMAPNRVIGRDGKLPWHLPEDLAFFKRTTKGHPVVMGRKTYESLGRPLPARRNIVLTRDPQWQAEGVETISSPENLWNLPDLAEQVFIIGGAEVFAAFAPRIDRWLVSHIAGNHEGDVFMPPFEDGFPKDEVVETFRGFQVRRYSK